MLDVTQEKGAFEGDFQAGGGFLVKSGKEGFGVCGFLVNFQLGV